MSMSYVVNSINQELAEAHAKGGDAAVKEAVHGNIGGAIGMASGALVGAAAGSFVPVVGTVVGGIVGAFIGGLRGRLTNKTAGDNVCSAAGLGCSVAGLAGPGPLGK